MRQLVVITPARVANRSMPHSKTLYGPLWGDMCRFLAVKYRLDLADVRALVGDVFRYIDAEVMRNNEYMSIPGFGTFRRREQNHAGGFGPDVPVAEWMKLDRSIRKYTGTLFTLQEDEEDAGPR